MTNDAIATVMIVLMVVLIAWQWQRYDRAQREIASLKAIINVYRDGKDFGLSDSETESLAMLFADAADDALPEEL